MFPRCLSCYTPFPANSVLERIPVGARIAYDPARGRLWAICAACARWTLQPIEERWEALEDLERAVRDRARLLGQTENIGLYEWATIEIVRVGRAERREEAWWRYGREFESRRDRAKKVVRRGRFMQGAAMFFLTGIPFVYSRPERWIDRARSRHFGALAWRGDVACPACGGRLRRVRFREADVLRLDLGPDDTPALRIACSRCGPGAASGFRIGGTAAEHVLRRSLAYHNFAGATRDDVAAAMVRVDRADSLPMLIRSAPDRELRIGGSLAADTSLALEIALNADVERRQLEMELAELESRWREEEELAAIIDRELTPLRRRSSS